MYVLHIALVKLRLFIVNIRLWFIIVLIIQLKYYKKEKYFGD